MEVDPGGEGRVVPDELEEQGYEVKGCEEGRVRGGGFVGQEPHLVVGKECAREYPADFGGAKGKSLLKNEEYR